MMRALRNLSLLLGSLLLASLVFTVLWAGVKIAIDPQQDDELHLAEKNNYLARVAELPNTDQRPNIVFILFDDLGFGDLGFTGSQAIATPTMDQLALDGLVLTNFYSPAPVCTPARAGYLTGRLPLRAGMPQVVFPRWSLKGNSSQLVDYNKRFPAEEITLADVLQASGYATGMVGKWHLGDRSPSLPNDMGFQDFFGALYSNDMDPFALYRNRDIEIESPADQTRLNEWYGDAATEFIEKNSDAPFFLYFAHNFPHIPLYRPTADEGRSQGGLYGDVIEGLDDVVARLVNTLKAEGVYDNTLILITSDNGPWYQGSPGDARGRKADTFEGGMHVPMVAHWPAKLEGGRELAGLSMGTDWFPTILDWLNLPLPSDRIVDGKSLRPMLEQNAPSPNEYLYYFAGEELMAVRDAKYKYHEKRPVTYVLPTSWVSFAPTKGPWLFNTDTDFNESYDVSMLHPQVSQRLRDVLDDKREEMAKNKRGWVKK
jgi:arylsulfatase A-like enzyme